MIVGGCDVGSATGKAVVMNDGEIVSYVIIPSTTKPEVTARTAMDEAIEKAGLSSLEDLEYIVGTGYGRLKVPFANENISEITCHARGAYWLSSTVRTVVDIGGQDCKVMSLDDKGNVLEFVMNDRSLKSKSPAVITSQCSVFSESEVVTLINEGTEVVDIAAGVNNAVAGRLNSMVRKVGLVEDVALTGGCAKNEGLAKALEGKLGISVKKLPHDPQIAGAIGAALIAAEKLSKQSEAISSS